MGAKLKSVGLMLLLLTAISIIPGQTLALGEVYTSFSGLGYGGGDSIYCDQPITFEIHYFNNTSDVIIGMTNGYRLFANDGTVWQTPTVDTAGGLDNYFNLVIQLATFSVDGAYADTFGLGAAAISGGLPIGYDNIVLTISTQIDCSETGGTICLDSTWYPPGGDWVWGLPGSVYEYPDWDGPHCFEIFALPPPEIIATSPTQNELNVTTSTDITVTFNMDMDETTIDNSSFVVNAASTGQHQGLFTYDGPSKTVTFNPNDDFDIGEVVTVVLTTDIKSLAGASMNSSYIWSFTNLTTNGPAIFVEDSTYSLVGEPRSVVAADLNGDGFIDLASANITIGSVSILLNDGSGVFGPSASSYNVSPDPRSIYAGDLDGDGDVDLITANTSSDNVTVLMNDGSGGFSDSASYGVGTAPFYVCAADLDGDGYLDLATADNLAHTVTILINNGSGIFVLGGTYTTDQYPNSVHAADFDSDGDLDLVTAGYYGTVSVLLNNGDATFGSNIEYSVDFWPVNAYPADIDNDGDIDLAVANYGSHTVTTLLNNGSGVFASLASYPVGVYPRSMAVCDFNGDGYLDLAASNMDSDNISILMNNGDGTYTIDAVYQVGDKPLDVVGADFDKDGDIDLATANRFDSTITILENRLNEPPSITNGVATIVENHCNMLYYDFDADDPDGDDYWFELIDGPGAINTPTGEWTYQPTMGDVGTAINISVRACDSAGCGDPWYTEIIITNNAPVIDNCIDLRAYVGETLSHQFTGYDPDPCDPPSFAVVSVIPSPTAPILIFGDGTLEFTPDPSDARITFEVEVAISDGLDEATCIIFIDVVEPAPRIRLTYTPDAIAGQYEFISIVTEDMEYEMGGFDFLIGYDSSALMFMGAEPGQLLEDCGWEYFTYRHGADGNCGDACPDGLLRIMAIAETPNGDEHPSCYGPDETIPHELANMKFLVSSDLAPGDSVLIDFCWCNCGDNDISSVDSEVLYVDRAIYDFTGILIWDEDDDDQFPEDDRIPCVGRPDTCANNDTLPTVRYIDYQFGGMHINTTKEFYTIPEAYANIGFINGTEVNVWGEYTTETDGRLVTSYLSYRKREMMPPFSIMFMTGLVPDSGYWHGGIIIATGILSTEYDSLTPYPDDSLEITINVTDLIYIDSGFDFQPDTVNFPSYINLEDYQKEPDEGDREDCDSCKFAILVSGGVNNRNNDPGYWEDIERLYKHKVDSENYCPENIEVIYYLGQSGDPAVIPHNRVHRATAAEVRAAHDRIAAKLHVCDSAGDTATVQKMFTNHGSPTGICLLGENELTGDSLTAWQNMLIDSCCDYLYDEITTCYGGRIVNSLKKLKDTAKTEIHVNSEAGPNSSAWGYSWGSLYLAWKIKALQAGLPYTAAVDIARLKWREDMVSHIETKLARLQRLIQKYYNLSWWQFLKKRALRKQIDKLKEDIKAETESLNDPGLAFDRLQFKVHCEWKRIDAPKGGQIRIEFKGKDGCANVTIYEVMPDGTIKKIRIWNWNLPGSLGYVEGNDTRVINVSTESTGIFWIHNDNGEFTLTAESFFSRPFTETPSNVVEFAGFSLGATDSSSAEFGDIFQPDYYICCVNIEDFNLSNIPAMMDPWETVHTLTTQFEIVETNAWWGNMELSLNILSVLEPGNLLITCNDPGISDTSIMITGPGEYTVHLGAFQARGSVELTFHTPQTGGASIEFDSWALKTLVPTWPPENVCGDNNGDELVNIFDITYLISYLYKGGPPPIDMNAADVNSDSAVNIFDITYLISYLYKNGPPPNCP